MVALKNILTIDLEDWYHGLLSQEGKNFESRLEFSVYKLLNLLGEKKVKATFFVLGEVAEKFPKIIGDIFQAGHEIAIHGYHHKLVTDLSEEEFREDISRARDCLKQIIPQKIIGYRAPFFSLKRNMLRNFEILTEEGFKYDSSIFPRKTPLYGDPGASPYPFWLKGENWKIREFPPLYGGFYFRTLPTFLTIFLLQRINRTGQPFVFYSHPWEIDSQQPRPPRLNLREKITHYYNLSTTYNKLRFLLDNFEFTTILEYENQIAPKR